MSTYPQQIFIRRPLRDFIAYIEVYCTVECCGVGAAEVHPALLIRKSLDGNIAGFDGNAAFNEAKNQIEELSEMLDSLDIQCHEGQVPFWSELNSDLPDYWLNKDDAIGWVQSLHQAFSQASRHIGSTSVRHI
jgi:hypothetical protein